jgi:hypothetical protein
MFDASGPSTMQPWSDQHLSHVFAKLGVSTRAELATQATKRGLAES